jgi:hypothetical protein
VAEGSGGTTTADGVLALSSESLRIDQLAIVHAALRDDAVEWQQDVVVNAAIEVLTGRDLACAEITRVLAEMWATEAITETVVAQALKYGSALGLVTTQPTLSGETRWQATDGARRDAEADKQWARKLVSDFSAEICIRADELELSVKDSQLERLTSVLLQAVAVAASGVYEVDSASPAGLLRPVEFRSARAAEWVQAEVQPKSIRDLCLELLPGVVDPLDDFGGTIVHHLVIGNLLRGVMGRHNLVTGSDLGGMRLLLDTSVLLDLVDEGAPEQGQLLQAIELTTRAKGEVVVAEHTLAEWERVWEAADHEHPERVDTTTVPRHTDVLARNPFVRTFFRMKQSDPGLSWVRFQVGRRDIRKRLHTLGITVRPHGNTTEADLANYANALAAFEVVNRDRPHPRSTTRVEADAQSVAMVLRWREQSPGIPCAAYFCARDNLTKAAFEAMSVDHGQPLVVNPGGWTMFMARMSVGSPEERNELVRVVGSSAVRDSFLAMATMYTADDAIRCAEIMRENGDLSLHDLRTVVQLQLTEMLTGEDSEPKRHAEEAIRLRTERRDARSKREAAAARQVAETAQREAEIARRLAAAADQRRAEEGDALRRQHNDALAEHKRVAEQESQQRDQMHRQNIRWLVTVLLGTILTAAFIIVAVVTDGVPSTKTLLLQGCFVTAVLLTGADAALHPDRSRYQILVASLLTVVLGAIGVLL